MRRNVFVLRDRARRLRRDQTEAARRLWARLRARQLCGIKFRCQHPIGQFITDFCCLEKGLVIELDGGRHALRAEADEKRSLLLSRLLSRHGYRVLRFWDNDVLDDIEAVLQQIADAAEHPHPNPLPQQGEGETVSS